MRFYVYEQRNKDQIIREDFEKLNFEAESEHWLEKVFRLAIQITLI